MTTDPQTYEPPPARQILESHGVPEDVIDGVLALYAQEMAAWQRNVHDTMRPGFHMGQPCGPAFDCHVAKVIDTIDPTRADVPTASSAAVSPPPATDRAASYRLATDATESMQGYPHLILPEEIVAALRLLAAGEQPEPGSPAYIRRLAAGERDEQQAQQSGPEARECPPGVHSMFDFCPGDCGEPVADDPACTCASAGDAFVPSGHYADCPCPEARQQHGPAAAPVAGQPPADTTGEEARPRFVRVCIACPECDHTLDEDGACANGCTTPPAVVAEPGKESDAL